MQNEALFKTYSYANGKYEEQTIYKEDMMKKLIDMKVDYITTDQPLEATKLVK